MGRLARAALIAQVVNFWWFRFPVNLSREVYKQQFLQDQWALGVAHFTPWLTYWHRLTNKMYMNESLHHDIMIGFGSWEFDPMDLENPFPTKEGSIHLWHGDDDRLVPVTLQRYIVEKLPWIHYHELSGSGHMFPYMKDMADNIIRTLFLEKSKQ